MRKLALILFFLSTAPYSFSQVQKPIDIVWLPITDAERNMKAPVVEKDAGVEAIFWRVHVRDEFLGQDLQRVLYHYVRLKIFDEKGKEAASTIDLPTSDKIAIVSLNGRTIKADGTEIELKKDSVFERDVVRAGRKHYRVKSFAMPGVEPGAIVEYRWKELRTDPSIRYTRLQFQREYPVQKVTYFVHPLPERYGGYQMFSTPFHCQPSALKPEDDGFVSTTLENVPAFHEEPMMPGEPNVRPWLLLMYRENGKFPEPEKYWNNAGKDMYNEFLKAALKPNDEIRQAAAASVAGATTDDQKITALTRYVRKNVRGLFSAQVTEAERAKILKQMPDNRLRTSPEVLKSGIGTANEMNTLFASMASCVGLEVRPALVADREDIIFTPSLADRYFLPNVDMAVQLGGKWSLHDVSAHLLPSSMVTWREEGMQVLLSDSKKPVFIESPLSPPEASTAVRSGKFALSEDGTLEGDVDQVYSGHMAMDHRIEIDGEEEARRLELLKQQYTTVFPDAEVSDLKIEGADDPERPLKLHCHIKLPGYAPRTGKRILLQPLFFERGVPPLFAAAERRHPVDFHYAWLEQDNISITLPSGFSLDNAGNPGPITFGAPGGYQLKMTVKDGHELVCFRELVFGKGGNLEYPVNVYPQLKKVFDEVHRRDDVTISLKQGPAAGVAQ
ncbi:MAG: DUF3857 domain-containing protein [Bryobacteraceae bacterium]|jgi:hypothetical protein